MECDRRCCGCCTFMLYMGLFVPKPTPRALIVGQELSQAGRASTLPRSTATLDRTRYRGRAHAPGGISMKIRTSIAAGAFAIGLTTLTAAAAAPASFNSGDKIGCHAAWDVHLHGLSGVGIPLATVVADLQVTTVTGNSPYKADATAL